MAKNLGEVVGAVVRGKVAELVGVMSFSKCPDSPSMWDRYGDGHKGAMLMLNEDHAFFRCHADNPDSPQTLRPVKYLVSRTPRNMMEMSVDELFFVKTDDWRSEQEVRMVRLLKDATDTGVKDANGNAVHTVQLPPVVIAGLVVGSRIGSGERKELCDLLQASDYAHAQLYEMRLDRHGTRLEICRVP